MNHVYLVRHFSQFSDINTLKRDDTYVDSELANNFARYMCLSKKWKKTNQNIKKVPIWHQWQTKPLKFGNARVILSHTL